MKRSSMSLLCVMMAGAACFTRAADVELREVLVRQRWPWSPKVDIHYVLACDATQRVDVAVEGFNNGASIGVLPEASLSGDTYSVSYGEHRIVWDPTLTAYSNTPLANFSVALTLAPEKTYLIIDLSKTAGQEGQITYRTEPGIWYDVTNDMSYATNKLVLRRIPAGAYVMGAPSAEIKAGVAQTQHSVTLTRPFYLGVFEFTQAQYKQITGSYAGNFTVERDARPASNISYDNLRGTTLGRGWPTNSAVDATSFIGQLRTRTGLGGLDLPTEAQWEYACRAGTATAWNNGSDITNSTADANLDRLGRYQRNGGYCWTNNPTTGQPVYFAPPNTIGVSNGTARAGSYAPNAWGLYDMHGNVTEWCLDYYTNNLGSASVKDPRGPLTWEPYNNYQYVRMRRGGSYDIGSVYCRSAYRCEGYLPYMQAHNGMSFTGFRVALPVPVVQAQ